MIAYPETRFRRLRRTPVLRYLIAETHVKPSDFILPFFVVDGKNRRQPIASMPGIYQQSIDNVLIDCDQALKLGIKSVMLFGVPEGKDPQASLSYDNDAIIQQATRALKKQFGQDLVVMTDTCLCEYTNHGHCGIVLDQQIVNDPSVDVLVKAAVSQARAGADMVCPSDMMDGRIGAIRQGLDKAGFGDTPIMAYAVKYASALYAPFRDGAESAPSFGDRRSYQMDTRNQREALMEADQDVLEGADLLMIKPALGTLDIVSQVRQRTLQPIVVYNVSGEYAMVKAAVQAGWLNEEQVVLEFLTSFKRAGASLVATYHAMDAAKWLASS